MPDSLWTIFVLSAAAFGGGAVNAIAGGGTLLTFPSLLAILSPVSANATSTMALMPGSLASGWAYRQELGRTIPHLKRLWPPSLMGGIVGALLVTRLPERVFAHAIPWLLVGASVLLLVQRPLARCVGAHPHAVPASRTLLGVVLFQFCVGV
ncbi:MAG TPA: sulfite exporter TauE/SafE family protein, partial [Bryobacteraceae bacterium]|nr:sulfite exporter TauE/SafE family protein [Bryobacteraceae bacterium]